MLRRLSAVAVIAALTFGEPIDDVADVPTTPSTTTSTSYRYGGDLTTTRTVDPITQAVTVTQTYVPPPPPPLDPDVYYTELVRLHRAAAQAQGEYAASLHAIADWQLKSDLQNVQGYTEEQYSEETLKRQTRAGELRMKMMDAREAFVLYDNEEMNRLFPEIPAFIHRRSIFTGTFIN